MKLLKRSLTFVLLGIYLSGMIGCAPKESSAQKVSNDTQIVTDMKQMVAIIEEVETQKKKAEEAAKQEVAQPEEKPAEKPVVSTPKPSSQPNNKPSTSTTNKVSSKYPYYIKVNRLANCVTIYKQDGNGVYTVPVKAMICSVGKNINNTPTGVFKTSDKYTWRYLFGDQYGQYATRITGHILFHSVPYTSQSKNTLRTDYYNNLGVGDSMGCIRLTCSDAKWIYDNCAKGTTVEIYDHYDPGPLGKPTAMKIDVNSPYAKWDPTDPDANNPWKTAKPTITGVADLTITQGEIIDYLANVSAVDALGVSLNVSINGTVDIENVGQYTITYTVTDARGNTTTKTAVITVVEREDSEENEGQQNADEL